MKSNYHAQIVIALLLLSSLGFVPVSGTYQSDIEVMDIGTRSVSYLSYHGYDATMSILNDMVRENPNIASLHDLGDTSQGRDIMAVKVSDDVGTDDDTEPDILYMGAHHGNEPISAEVPLYILDYLLSNYESNGTIRRWIDTTEIWFIPMVNPDGIEAGTRKNANGTGVDLNRNYDQNWGTEGTSNDPDSNVYCGEYPFSEPETKAIRELALDRQFTLSMSFHSYGEVIYYPWGNSIDTVSPQKDLLENIGSEIGERNGYMPTEANMDGTYITSGDSDDWLYSIGTLPFTVELSTVYAPPEHEIQDICEKNLESSLYLLDIANEPEASMEDDWTFMVYMAGDNSLSSEALKDLNEMEVGGSTQDVNIITLFDGATVGDSKIFQVTKDPNGYNAAITSQVIDDLGAVISPATNEVNMSSHLVLEDFIDWTMDNYPARNNALIIWDHGDGLFGGLARDGTYWMPTWDMRQTLIGHHFDIIGMDLCWHGNLETAYELVGLADIFIGSIAEEPSEGWDYSAISEFLATNPNSDAIVFASEIIDSYQESTIGIPWATLSAIDLYLLEEDVMPHLDALSIRLRDLMYNEQSSIRGARSLCSVFDVNRQHFVDLGEFLDNLLAADTSTALEEYAISSRIFLERAVINSCSGIAYPNIAGMGIYLPEQIYDNRYSTMFQFSNSNWVDFLPVFRAPLQTPVIEHDIEVDVMGSSGSIDFNVTVIDDNLDTDELFINYRLGSGSWEKEDLVGSGSSYYASISSLGVYEVEYYFSATDLTGNTITYPYGINLGNTEYLSYEMADRPALAINSIEHSPIDDTLPGDNFTIRIQIENQGNVYFGGVRVILYQMEGNGNMTFIDDHTQSMPAGEMANATFNWVAEAGNHTLLMELTYNGESLDNITIEAQIADSDSGQFITEEELEDELNSLWLGVIVMVAGATLVSMGALIMGKRNIKRKKKALAFKAVDNATYYVNSFADFGSDISLASWKLEKARKAIDEEKYDTAYRLSIEAKRSVEPVENEGVDTDNGGI